MEGTFVLVHLLNQLLEAFSVGGPRKRSLPERAQSLQSLKMLIRRANFAHGTSPAKPGLSGLSVAYTEGGSWTVLVVVVGAVTMQPPVGPFVHVDGFSTHRAGGDSPLHFHGPNPVGERHLAGVHHAMKEVWKPVPGHPHYEVSNLGRVRSWVNTQGNPRETPLIRKPSYTGAYQTIRFAGGAKRYLHHVVLRAFGYPGRKGQEVRHKDGNPRNNRLSNLQWGTHRVNMRDQVHHGTHTRGHQNGNAKLSPKQVEAIRRSPLSSYKIAGRFGVHPSTICRIRRKERYVC